MLYIYFERNQRNNTKLAQMIRAFFIFLVRPVQSAVHDMSSNHFPLAAGHNLMKSTELFVDYTRTS